MMAPYGGDEGADVVMQLVGVVLGRVADGLPELRRGLALCCALERERERRGHAEGRHEHVGAGGLLGCSRCAAKQPSGEREAELARPHRCALVDLLWVHS
jgi:hypothetical protein